MRSSAGAEERSTPPGGLLIGAWLCGPVAFVLAWAWPSSDPDAVLGPEFLAFLACFGAHYLGIPCAIWLLLEEGWLRDPATRAVLAYYPLLVAWIAGALSDSVRLSVGYAVLVLVVLVPILFLWTRTKRREGGGSSSFSGSNAA